MAPPSDNEEQDQPEQTEAERLLAVVKRQNLVLQREIAELKSGTKRHVYFVLQYFKTDKNMNCSKAKKGVTSIGRRLARSITLYDTISALVQENDRRTIKKINQDDSPNSKTQVVFFSS